MTKTYISTVELGILGTVEIKGKVEAEASFHADVETVAYVNARAILQQVFEDDLGCEIVSIEIVKEEK